MYYEEFPVFPDEVQFDMFHNMKRTSLSGHISELNGKLPVLKRLPYTEPMALGNQFVKGINFLKAMALDKSFLDKETFNKYVFALKEHAGSEPMELTIEFVTKTGIPYIYSVDIMNTGIVFETLQISGLGSEENRNIFTRKEGKIVYAVTPSEEVGNIVQGWIEKNPFFQSFDHKQ